MKISELNIKDKKLDILMYKLYPKYRIIQELKYKLSYHESQAEKIEIALKAIRNLKDEPI